MHRRHNNYLRLMVDVSHHIVEAYMIHRRLVETRSAETRKHGLIDATRPKVTYVPLQYASQHNAVAVPIKSSIHYFKKFADDHTVCHEIQHFLENLKAQPVSGSGLRPITWLELYILYRIEDTKSQFEILRGRLLSSQRLPSRSNALRN